MLSDYLFRFHHMTLLTLAVAAGLAIIVLLRWTGQRFVSAKAALKLKGDSTYDYTVAGAEAHQPILGRIAGRSPEVGGQDCVAELVPDVSRAGELRAIWVTVQGARVGHIAAEEIAPFHAVLAGRPARCEAVEAPARSGFLVVRLDTVWPPRLD